MRYANVLTSQKHWKRLWRKWPPKTEY